MDGRIPLSSIDAFDMKGPPFNKLVESSLKQQAAAEKKRSRSK